MLSQTALALEVLDQVASGDLSDLSPLTITSGRTQEEVDAIKATLPPINLCPPAIEASYAELDMSIVSKSAHSAQPMSYWLNYLGIAFYAYSALNSLWFHSLSPIVET